MAQVSRTAKVTGVLIAVVVTAVIALQTIGPRGTMARPYLYTQVLYRHRTPPPWPNGNGFSTLIPRTTVESDGRGTGFGRYEVQGSLPRVRYRLVSPNNP